MANGFLPDTTPPGTSQAPLQPLPKAPIGQPKVSPPSSPIKRKFRGAPPQKKKATTMAGKLKGLGK